MKVKLLQWNSWYKEKIENIVSVLKRIDPDIICLQELTTTSSFNPNLDEAHYISRKLGVFYYYHQAQEWNINDTVRTQGNGIFSKFPLVKTAFEYTVLPAPPDTNDWGKEGRVYVEATVQIANKMLNIGTTHLSYTHRFINTPQKKKEIQNLLGILKTKQNQPYIFTGDLNSQPQSYTVKNICKLLKHAGPPFTEKTWTTKPFAKDGFKETQLNWRLDYVFTTSDIRINNIKIMSVSYSDHLPILLEMII